MVWGLIHWHWTKVSDSQDFYKKFNKTTLLLLTPFMVACTAPKSKVQPPKVVYVPPQAPVVVSRPQTTRPSLGTRISVPTTVSTVSQEQVPQEHYPSRAIKRQRSKHGTTVLLTKFKLPKSISETSGLIKIDNRLWTLNDSGGRARLYQISERNGKIVKTLNIQNARNRDWEDIAYDDNYVYIGDIGNNRGNRRDLKIYKIPRSALRTAKSVHAEVISFHYSDQKSFKSKLYKNNYDCEAMVAHHGKLYLFSKNWQNNKTRLYELNTQSGKHIATYIATFNTQGMVTGATINEELDILLLTTYSSLLDVNIWAFSNYRGANFFNGNHKRLNLKTSLHAQVEGITFKDNYRAYMSSEALQKFIFNFDSTLYELDFSGEFE